MEADSGPAVQQPPKKSTRSRVIQACIPCHRSKRKCNRRKPCSQCLKRRITGSCIYEALAAEDLSALEDSQTSSERENEILRSRIAELEAVIAELRNHRRDQTENSVRRRKRRDSEAVIDKDGVYYGHSLYLGGSAAPDLLHQMISLAPSEPSDLLFAFSGGSDHRQAESTQTTNIFQTVFASNYGIAEMQQLLASLGRDHLDALFEAFFEMVDPLHHYVPAQWLWERFDKCVDGNSAPQAQEAALIFAVLALGDLVSTNRCPNVLMAGALHLCRIANFLTSPSIDVICTFSFISVYLQHEGRLNEYWPLLGMVIRLAQSMGLHRDPKMIKNLPHKEGEIRRRLFHVIAAQETASSVMFGRPNGLGFFDCEMAKDISDGELYDDRAASQALYPFEISYNRCTWQLFEMSRELMEGSFDTSQPLNLPKAKAMEAKFLHWYNNLTPPLKYDPSRNIQDLQTPKDKAHYVQSLILHSHVQYNIVVLYRKSLLLDSSSESAVPCFEAAISVTENWFVLQNSFPRLAKVTWMHWHRVFHAALICLVGIKASTTRPDIRARALSSWNSCLQLFHSLQPQNESIKCCFRALNRLDQAIKAGMNPPESSNSEYGSPSDLKAPVLNGLWALPSRVGSVTSSNGSNQVSRMHSEHVGDRRVPFPAYTNTFQAPILTTGDPDLNVKKESFRSLDYGQAFESVMLEPSNVDSFQVQNAHAMPTAVPQLNIFDLDTNNWPTWLIDEQSPLGGINTGAIVGRPDTSSIDHP